MHATFFPPQKILCPKNCTLKSVKRDTTIDFFLVKYEAIHHQKYIGIYRYFYSCRQGLFLHVNERFFKVRIWAMMFWVKLKERMERAA